MIKIKKELVDILDNIISKGKYSNIEINYHFAKNSYNAKEKAFMKNLLVLCIKNLIYIDKIIDRTIDKISKRKIRQLLRLAICQMLFMDKNNNIVLNEAVEVAKEINEHQAKFVNMFLNKFIKNKERIMENIPEDIKLSYPKWLYDKIKIDYPDNYLDILLAYKKRSYISIRINQKKVSKQKFENILADDIVFQVENVYYLKNSDKLSQLKDNEYFIQDASSYIVSMNMDVENDDVVLDACASPGGKSAAILSCYNPKLLIASDIYEHKIELLEKMKEKYEFDNMNIILNDATNENAYDNEYFDKILLDVPCSGLGVLRKKAEKIYNLESSDIKRLKKLQKKIFETNLKFLKKGGTIIYSTCTITKNENTNNIKYFLEKYKDLEVVEAKIPDNVKYTKDEYNGVYIDYRNEYLDGFYFIKLKKV